METDPYYDAAYECGRLLAEAGFRICNGGYGGIMEASAKGAQEAGGETVGITVSSWSRKPNQWIQKELRTASLNERLTKLVELGDAYIVLPGGTGTLLEFATVLELTNKEVIRGKPIVLLGSFWDGVVETLRSDPAAIGEDYISRFVHKVRSPEELVEYLKGWAQQP